MPVLRSTALDARRDDAAREAAAKGERATSRLEESLEVSARAGRLGGVAREDRADKRRDEGACRERREERLVAVRKAVLVRNVEGVREHELGSVGEGGEVNLFRN